MNASSNDDVWCNIRRRRMVATLMVMSTSGGDVVGNVERQRLFATLMIMLKMT